jgi:hypothetical protein
MNAVTAFPLAWPFGWKRTPPGQRRRAKFGKTMAPTVERSWRQHADITIADATARLLDELGRMGVSRRDVILSTNLKLRGDGLPLSAQRMPDDPGAAVYWHGGREHRCLAIDHYDKVEHNIAALAATIEAMRAIERHGGAQILDRAFSGFTALPAPGAARTWREVLEIPPGVKPTLDEIQQAYRSLASKAHPDKGGSDAAMSELNAARAKAEEALRG